MLIAWVPSTQSSIASSTLSALTLLAAVSVFSPIPRVVRPPMSASRVSCGVVSDKDCLVYLRGHRAPHVPHYCAGQSGESGVVLYRIDNVNGIPGGFQFGDCHNEGPDSRRLCPFPLCWGPAPRNDRETCDTDPDSREGDTQSAGRRVCEEPVKPTALIRLGIPVNGGAGFPVRPPGRG